jgi:CRP-like cAMP-binding protein
MTLAFELFRDSDKKQKLNTGQFVFEAGETGDAMYVVLDGQIEILANGKVVNTVNPGEVFGEMALVDNSPRSAGARAAKPSIIVPVDKFNFLYFVEHSPLFALEVMSTMAERLRGRLGANNA